MLSVLFAAACVALNKVPTIATSTNGLLDVTLVYGLKRIDLGDGSSFMGRVYNGSVPGPKLVVRGGDTLRIRLINSLEDVGPYNSKMNTYRSPNVTNLHTHGLHVTPVLPGDDVRMFVMPGSSYQYQYKIPADHAPGLHWYHPHFHGSSALQVFSGGYGVLEVLHPSEGVPATLPTLEMPIGYMDFNGVFSAALSGAHLVAIATTSTDDLILADAEAGRLPAIDKFLIDGEVLPTYRLQQCESTRLRVIFAAAGSELTLRVRHPESNRCPPCELSLIARDGHQLRQFPRPITGSAYVPTGGRADLLVRCPVACEGYQLTSHDNLAVLAHFEVAPSSTCAPAIAPLSLTPQYHTSYTPNLMASQVSENNKVSIQLLDPGFQGCRYITNSPTHGRIDRFYQLNDSLDTRHVMRLGEVYELSLAQSALHPFHTHIQPYQIIGGSTYADQGNFATGDYVDTSMFDNLTLRYRPVHFTGPQMFHCHVLSHEDQGCMAQFQIVDAGPRNRHRHTPGAVHSPASDSIHLGVDSPVSSTTSLLSLIIGVAAAAVVCLFYTFRLRGYKEM